MHTFESVDREMLVIKYLQNCKGDINSAYVHITSSGRTHRILLSRADETS